HYIPVATVVATATQHGDASGRRPESPQLLEGAAARPRHEFMAGNAEFRDGDVIQPADLFGGIEAVGEIVHGGYHSVMTLPQYRAAMDYQQLADAIRRWGHELGFRDVGIAGVDLS